AIVHGKSGLQFEYRRASIQRSPENAGALLPVGALPVIAPGQASRSDWVLRARTQPTLAFTGELFYGTSLVEDPLGLPPADSLKSRNATEHQTGARASLAGKWGFVRAEARVRDNERVPRTQGDVVASITPLPL